MRLDTERHVVSWACWQNGSLNRRHLRLAKASAAWGTVTLPEAIRYLAGSSPALTA